MSEVKELRFLGDANAVELPQDTAVAFGKRLFVDVISENVTVASGETDFRPNPVIDTGFTYTVDAGGKLLYGCDVIVNGTMIVNGDGKEFAA